MSETCRNNLQRDLLVFAFRFDARRHLLYRNPFIVFAHMRGAFVHGIGLSAICLRTNTILFPVILHGLHDLALKYTNFPAIPLDMVQVTSLMFYRIYLLRGWKNPEMS